MYHQKAQLSRNQHACGWMVPPCKNVLAQHHINMIVSRSVTSHSSCSVDESHHFQLWLQIASNISSVVRAATSDGNEIPRICHQEWCLKSNKWAKTTIWLTIDHSNSTWIENNRGERLHKACQIILVLPAKRRFVKLGVPPASQTTTIIHPKLFHGIRFYHVWHAWHWNVKNPFRQYDSKKLKQICTDVENFAYAFHG